MLKHIITLTLIISISHALNNGLARTPPMGWNSWNHFGCQVDCKTSPDTCVSEELFKGIADALVDSGLDKVGYKYVNIDDCWIAKTRDAQGKLQADPERFPNGIKALADYIHSKGLKFGIYEDVGVRTCGGYPGSRGNETLDAQTFADWGVDFLKLDGCNIDKSEYEMRYKLWHDALNATSRPIVYSCSWPAYMAIPPEQFPHWNETREICNLWRYYHDIRDEWKRTRDIMTYTADHQTTYQPLAGPGAWNDPDMFEIGNGGQSTDQYRSLMSVWAIMASPFILGNDLRSMDQVTLDLLSNKRVIEIDQDVLGTQGTRAEKGIAHEIYIRPLHDGSFAAATLNTGIVTEDITLHFSLFGWATGTNGKVVDVWSGADLGVMTDNIKLSTPRDGVRLVRVWKV